MTDSASWRRRRRGGRHQEPIRRTPSNPLPSDAARQNRESAFGTSKRTWVNSPAPQSSAQEPSPLSPAEKPETTDVVAPGSTDAAASGAEGTAETPSPAATAAGAAAAASDAAPSLPRAGSGKAAARSWLPATPTSSQSAAEPEPTEPSSELAEPSELAANPPEPSRSSQEQSEQEPPADAPSAGGPLAPPAGIAAAASMSDASPDAGSGRPEADDRPAAPDTVLETDAPPSSEPPADAAPAAEADAPAPGHGRRALRTPSQQEDAWSVAAPQNPQENQQPQDPQRSQQDTTTGAPGPAATAAAGAAAAEVASAPSAGSAAPPPGSASPDAPSGATTPSAQGPSSEAPTEFFSPVPPPPRPAQQPAASEPAGPADAASEPQRRPLRRREEPPPEGSLGLVSLWTVATSFIPGLGLLTTRLRRIGWLLLAILVVGVVGLVAWALLGSPVKQGLTLLSNRWVLIGLLLAVLVAGLVWLGQIVLTSLAQVTKERLRSPRRYIAFALAAVMVVAVALPFGRGVQSLWAAQGLLGSDSVFAGGDGSEIGSGKDPWAGAGRINIMLLGQDAGQDREGTRPDTLMVASIDTQSGKTALFSIPRNLEHVRFPEGTSAAEEFPDGFRYFGKNQDLINGVWTWANDRPDLFPGDDDPGLTATTWAVEETLGLDMDYYAMVDLQGFEDMVDAIGGVDMVVERRIPIGGGTNQATGGKYPIDGYIEPGEQKLDGFHALWYARSREGSNDFDRICRQQRMVRAVTEEADPATLAVSVPGLVTATEKNIETDIPVSRLDAFIDLATRIQSAGFTSYPITQDVTPSYDADWDYLKDWVQASIEDSMAQEAPESVLGETEPGSTEPAPTGEAPDEEETEGEESAAPETTESETPSGSATEETPTEDEESSSDAGTATPTPTIDQNPLESCLPGADAEG